MQKGSKIQRKKHLVKISDESELNKMKNSFFSSCQVYATSIWPGKDCLFMIEDCKKMNKLLLGFHFFFIMCLRMFSLRSSISVCTKFIMI